MWYYFDDVLVNDFLESVMLFLMNNEVFVYFVEYSLCFLDNVYRLDYYNLEEDKVKVLWILLIFVLNMYFWII